MVSSWFNTNSKEKTSKITVLGKQVKGDGEAEGRDVQPLQAYVPQGKEWRIKTSDQAEPINR
jgi:hypothetical protein